MDTDELNKKTRELCLYRRRVFKGTSLEQLYNRYLNLRSLLPFRPGCCSEICPGCYRSLSHLDRICRVKLLNQKRNKASIDQIRETFACRFCRVRISTRAAASKTISAPRLKPSTPPEVLGLSPLSTLSSEKSRKKRKKKKRDGLMKEMRLQQSCTKKVEREEYELTIRTENKQDLRKHMKLILASIPSSVRSKYSELLTQSVLTHEFYKAAKGISIYVSLATEPDTSTLIGAALGMGKIVVVPQIISEALGRSSKLSARLGLMRMRRLDDLDQLLSWPLNMFGVREPPQPSDGVDQDDALTHFMDLFIVPGLAFTMKGERLGRGKGFYDRYLTGIRGFYLEAHPNRPLPCTLALAFPEQIVDRMSTEQHDVFIDAVISI
ncbi:hypothetical protein TcWFU_008115 [Taenia crassiceps]|uniref:5-formyltetrahydrofolate cyclo-ligase n=1 Tax=Taenia crassiceps TaxID=6207 RepID=A0ABR4QSI1_9CEST